jgi:hypothetical protein
MEPLGVFERLLSQDEEARYGLARAETAGKPLQEVESAGSRSHGWRPQARSCLERREVARRIARNVAWSEPGNHQGWGFPGGLDLSR